MDPALGAGSGRRLEVRPQQSGRPSLMRSGAWHGACEHRQETDRPKGPRAPRQPSGSQLLLPASFWPAVLPRLLAEDPDVVTKFYKFHLPRSTRIELLDFTEARHNGPRTAFPEPAPPLRGDTGPRVWDPRASPDGFKKEETCASLPVFPRK